VATLQYISTNISNYLTPYVMFDAKVSRTGTVQKLRLMISS